MRITRILGSAALTIFVVALCCGNASATVLCKTNTTPCGSQVSVGTTVEMSLSGVSLMKAGATDECKSSEWSWKVEKAGSSTSTVSGKVEPLKFSSCNCETKVLKSGETEVHSVSGTMNGTQTSKSAEITANCAGIDCVYGTGTGTSLGTLTGGEPAKLDVSATLAKISGSFACPSTASWTATYEVKTPKPLYVAGYITGEGPTSTTLTTSLSGEEKSGEEITVNEGGKVKDTAALSGTNASKATGTVKYKVYADKECKELVTSAGEVTVTSGSVPASEEKTLEAGRTYYWQAEYSGDSNNLASTSACGKEVLHVKATISLSSALFIEGVEESNEGEGVTVSEGTPVKDKETLSGTHYASATGTVSYKIYSDYKCKELLFKEGESAVVAGEASFSEEVEPKEGTYYWQADYSGDGLHQAAKSPCAPILNVGIPGFWSELDETTLVANQLESQAFEFGAGNKLQCTGGYYIGEFAGKFTDSVTVEPYYSDCNGLGGYKVEEVKPEGCKWKLTPRTIVKVDQYQGKAFLRCPGGSKLKILALDEATMIKCEVTVAEQEAQSVDFENDLVGLGLVVQVTPNLANLTYEVTKTEEGCKLPQAVGSYGGGKVTGKYTLEALGSNLLFVR